MRTFQCLVLLATAVAGASAAAECAFVGAPALARRAQVVTPAAVAMRGPVKSTKAKGAKIKSAASKRFKVTAGGKILRRRANKQHLLTAKKHKNKKAAGKIGQVSDAMRKNYLAILQP